MSRRWRGLDLSIPAMNTTAARRSPRPVRLAACLLAALTAAWAGACGEGATTLAGPTADKCQISVTAFTRAFGAAGGTGSVTLATARECSWSAASATQWISFPKQASGQGPASFGFAVAANPAARARGHHRSVGAAARDLTGGRALPLRSRFGNYPRRGAGRQGIGARLGRGGLLVESREPHLVDPCDRRRARRRPGDGVVRDRPQHGRRADRHAHGRRPLSPCGAGGCRFAAIPSAAIPSAASPSAASPSASSAALRVPRGTRISHRCGRGRRGCAALATGLVCLAGTRRCRVGRVGPPDSGTGPVVPVGVEANTGQAARRDGPGGERAWHSVGAGAAAAVHGVRLACLGLLTWRGQAEVQPSPAGTASDAESSASPGWECSPVRARRRGARRRPRRNRGSARGMHRNDRGRAPERDTRGAPSRKCAWRGGSAT